MLGVGENTNVGLFEDGCGSHDDSMNEVPKDQNGQDADQEGKAEQSGSKREEQ
jgi:hypothetical protein